MTRVLMIAVLVFGLGGSSRVSALTMQLEDQPDGRPTFLYRFQRPHFAQAVDTELLTGYHEFQAQLPLSSRLCAVMSLPAARLLGDYFHPGRTIVGNAYVGVHSWSGRGPAVSAGAFLPTAEAVYRTDRFVSLLYDPHHFQRFHPHLLTLHLNLAQSFVDRSGLYVRGEAGPDLWLPVGDETEDAGELLVHYGLGVGVSGPRWDVGLEFVGWVIATEPSATFSEASSHVLSAGVAYKGRRVTPALFVSKPTDEFFEDAVDWLLGVRLKVALD